MKQPEVTLPEARKWAAARGLRLEVTCRPWVAARCQLAAVVVLDRQGRRVGGASQTFHHADQRAGAIASCLRLVGIRPEAVPADG